MNDQQIVKVMGMSEGMQKWLRVTIVGAIMAAVLFAGFVGQASAAGAQQIEGIGYFDDTGACADPEGAGADFATVMTGDLVGCQYVFVDSYSCTPSGVYTELGTEVYVVEGPNGEVGTFATTYRFSAKFDDCSTLTGEIFGRCQHPITAGTGTGDFEGVTGRLDFKDDIGAGNFPYRGHLKF
jgi:hypothetical protein